MPRNAVDAWGGEDGGFCEAQLCPSERHSWVKTGLSGASLLPFERPTWMSGWTQLQGSMTPSRLLREPILHGMPRIAFDEFGVFMRG